MTDYLYGIHLEDFVIGVQGGIVFVWAFRQSRPRDVIASLVAGGLTANYLGPWVALHTAFDRDLADYISGMVGMPFCQCVVEYVTAQRERIGK
jgi:hypothetical protein